MYVESEIMNMRFVLEYVGYVIIQSVENLGFEFKLCVNYSRNILIHRVHLFFLHSIT